MKPSVFFPLSLLLINNVAANPDCGALYQQLQQQLKQPSLDAAQAVLTNMEAVCGGNQVLQAKSYYTDVLAKQANNLANQGRLSEAETTLDKAQLLTWTVASVRGDIAAKRKQWREAMQFYGQAYDLLGDVQANSPGEQAKLDQQRQQLANLANDAQLVYGKIDSTKTRDGLSRGIRLSSRNIGVQATALPVHFQSNAADLDSDSLKTAAQLVEFIKSQPGLSKVVILGFADPRGSSEHNQRLSERRAQTVVAYLRKQGIGISLEAQGKGESAPPRTNLQGLTEAEQLQRWRRVEMVVQ